MDYDEYYEEGGAGGGGGEEEDQRYPAAAHEQEPSHFETITPETLRKQKLQQRTEEERPDDLYSPARGVGGQQQRGSKRPALALSAPETPPPAAPPPASQGEGAKNPFAKKRMAVAASPNKKSVIAGLLTSPSPGKTTPALSRSSTFSAKGRDTSKSAKRII